MPKTKVTETTYTGSDGIERTQYRVTVPKDLAETFEMSGKYLEWKMGGAADRLEVEVVEGDE
jgi:hypothetical protein